MVVLNIPFVLCGAVVALWLTNQTINLMTLGGLSLAIVASAEAKVAESRAGIRRYEADASRRRSEFGRIEQLFRERAQTGSLLDETRN